MTNKQIDALLPTLSGRPQCWYDKVNELVENGFTFIHKTAEWLNKTTGERGRISFTDTKAWLKHPNNPNYKP